MSLSKRAVATSFVLSALILSSISLSQSSYAKDKTPSPRASIQDHSATRQHNSATLAAPATINSSPQRNSLDAGCVKTNAVAHNPVKVGYPDPKVAMVDRVFTLNTNCGQIVFKAFGKKATATVIAMTFLAKNGYFDHSLCHRLTTASIFVLQCGDPTASGSGGPPFTYRDENLPSDEADDYPAGTIAMANSGPNTNGSQFFIVYKDSYLPPSYTVWGQVTQGLDIVKKVATSGIVGGGTDGTPKQTIALDSVSVK